MFYVYRCTTDKLEHHLNRITESGDTVFGAQFVGGRDWVIIGSKASEPSAVRVERDGSPVAGAQ